MYYMHIVYLSFAFSCHYLSSCTFILNLCFLLPDKLYLVIQTLDFFFDFQGLVDMNKPPEMISGNMTAGRCNNWSLVSQFLFSRSHQSIEPSLMLMFLCSNVCVFWTLYEVCMDGTTAKLLASGMPCF